MQNFNSIPILETYPIFPDQSEKEREAKKRDTGQPICRCLKFFWLARQPKNDDSVLFINGRTR